MIRVSQFVKNSQLCNYVTKALKRSLCLCLFLCHFMTQSLTRSLIDIELPWTTKKEGGDDGDGNGDAGEVVVIVMLVK